MGFSFLFPNFSFILPRSSHRRRRGPIVDRLTCHSLLVTRECPTFGPRFAYLGLPSDVLHRDKAARDRAIIFQNPLLLLFHSVSRLEISSDPL